MNQPCDKCLRGLVYPQKKVCVPCLGTGFMQEKKEVAAESVIEKVKKVVKKVIKKKK